MEQVVKGMIVILSVISILAGYIFYNNNQPLLIHYINKGSSGYIRTSQTDLHISKALTNVTIQMETEKLNNYVTDLELKPNENKHVTYSATPVTVKMTKLSTSGEGYIFPYSVWEEQTNGANNLCQLQILAKQMGMQIVEPFAQDSIFTMRGIAPNFSKALRFGDYFDKDKWNEMVAKVEGNPLVDWEKFITKAPRSAIILHTLKKKDFPKSLIIAYDENITVCGTESRIVHHDMLWIKETFNVIKTVCYLCSTYLQHPLTVKNFTSIIFNSHNIKPSEVTLIIVDWLGIRGTRIHLTPITLFTNKLNQKLSFPPSQRVMTAYQSYLQQYIGDHKYVGIIFRTRHVLFFNPESFDNQTEYLLQCSKNLSKVLDKVRKDWKIFLAYDMGMFGSKKYVLTNKNLPHLQQQIFLDVFNGSLQVHERNQNLIKAANGITDIGLIAQLEKVIATNADCLVLLGKHSAFVRSSGLLYMSQHPTNRCIVSICGEKVYDDNHDLISSSNIPSTFLNH